MPNATIEMILFNYERAAIAKQSMSDNGVREFFEVDSINQMIDMLPKEHTEFKKSLRTDQQQLSFPVDDVLQICRILIKTKINAHKNA